MSLRDVTVARDEKQRLVSANDITHQKRVEDFGRFWKRQWVETRQELRWDLPWGKTVGFRLLAETFVAGATHVDGGEGANEKASIERLCLSPYVEELLNSKVIKTFVPEQRSRYVFFEFLSLWTFDVRFTHSHILAIVHLSGNRVSIPALGI